MARVCLPLDLAPAGTLAPPRSRGYTAQRCSGTGWLQSGQSQQSWQSHVTVACSAQAGPARPAHPAADSSEGFPGRPHPGRVCAGLCSPGPPCSSRSLHRPRIAPGILMTAHARTAFQISRQKQRAVPRRGAVRLGGRRQSGITRNEQESESPAPPPRGGGVRACVCLSTSSDRKAEEDGRGGAPPPDMFAGPCLVASDRTVRLAAHCRLSSVKVTPGHSRLQMVDE